MKALISFLTTLSALIEMINANAREHASKMEREDGRRIGRLEAADEAMREAIGFLGAAEGARRNVRRQLSADPDELRLPDEYFRTGDANTGGD